MLSECVVNHLVIRLEEPICIVLVAVSSEVSVCFVSVGIKTLMIFLPWVPLLR